jgi:small-conductance mechanosensitive channel
MSIPALWLYVGTVVFFGALAVVRIAISLRRVRAVRMRRVKERRRFDAIATESPLEDPKGVARDRAFESINAQFSVTQRVLIPVVLLVTGALASIPFLGNFPAAVVSLIVGASAVLVGVAARPYVENVIAGLVISYSRMIRLGDTVEMEGYYGTVEDISATHTTVKLWDWRRYTVPNSQMLQTSLVNHSLYDRFVWAHVEFWVSLEADLDLVERLAREAAESSPRFHDHEPPQFWVMEVSKEGLRCWVAAWAQTPSDAWALKCDTRAALARSMREHGIVTHSHRVDMHPSSSDRPPLALTGE